jgi:hypothetical protein
MSTVQLYIALTAVVVAVALAACHDQHHFEGGELRELGPPLVTHFVATFEALPLDLPGEYSFAFRGFPVNRAGVVLRTPSQPRPEVLEALTTRIELSLVDHHGKLRCRGVGSPVSEGPSRIVVASNSNGATGLWHSDCSGVDLSTCDPCTLRVKLSEIDPDTPGMAVVPALVSRY